MFSFKEGSVDTISVLCLFMENIKKLSPSRYLVVFSLTFR